MYTFGSRVRYSETDEYGKLTLTGIMNYLQDCSTFQSEDNGLGISYLTDRNKAWWLSSWQIVVDRYPVLGERIVIGTWPYDFKGFYGYRNFTICDESGGYMVRANSVWFLFDTEKGRPVKIEPEDIRGYGSDWEKPLSMDYAPRRIQVPEEFTPADPVAIGKHHIDTNHHVNNAKYVEIAREVITDPAEVTELRVEYKKAAVFGDAVYPRISRTKEGHTVSLCDENGSAYAVIWLRGTTERK
ncbi:acyl-ACP thioesterase domain-containing protein [Lachnospiraceae bacterium 54-53]